MIPQRNLSLLSNRLARAGGRRIPEAILERDYCLAWFLTALSSSSLGRRLAFKGGTALKRCYFADYRFSEDLDFTLLEPMDFDTLTTELQAIYAAVHHASGIRFQFARQDRKQHPNGFTFFLSYEGPIPGAPREVKVDVTRREHLVFPLAHQPVLRGYEEYADLPDSASLLVYSLNEIGAEKIVAIQDKARNEPRDLYDIWYLLRGHLQLSDVTAAVEEKWSFRQSNFTLTRATLATKETRYLKLWAARLSSQMVELPHFDEVLREVRRAFRQAELE